MSSLDAQIAEVEREIKYRENVYPRWARAGKIRQSVADMHLERMRDVLKTLTELRKMQDLAEKLAKENGNGNSER
jgi:hypothetical protein